MSQYDYLVIGAGPFGATCARELTDAGKRVLVLEKAGYVGGMAATDVIDGQIVSKHGGHVYHTSDRRLWEYVNRFGEWRTLHPHAKAMARGVMYSFPINLMTMQQVYGPMTPSLGHSLLASFKNGHTADNARDWCLQHIGKELYDLFIEGYTRKQWGKDPADLPASIIRRVPVRLTWDDGYFDDQYQGVPVEGYTRLVENMLAGIPVELGVDYLDRVTAWDMYAERVIYTGPIDALFGYQLGRLEYRSLRHEHERVEIPDYQGCVTVNYCDADVPYTRIYEWQHYWPPSAPQAHTIITRAYPQAVGEPFYPVADEPNQELYDSYARMAAQKGNTRLGGRLGTYRYQDMHQSVAAALRLVKGELA